MSDQGERTCPLCAEEMDLTDQQLKPCKCGYEICVWCWHHIMEMAEKDDTEGRCPACRAPYDKEKIVGMAANCERLVAEVNMEKKSKSQKAKSKSSEGRKQLSSVRVIQRNLVYIVGLPLHLANEDLLLRREYFGQYGKVLKVSMSRTSAGVIQQFPNNTCSVYITYSKEEEAIRCIQSVHGFVLEGRPLRVCFGTTKYCHAWLRNVPCTNPDCLYLHEVGSQEDSFTKDEIISAYTRSRVQQITGNASTLQRRSGNVLPPPGDDSCPSSSASMGKLIMKTAPITTASILKGSPPNGSNGRPIALPAAASWGTRASSFQSSGPSSGSFSGLLLKSESVERAHGSSAVESSDQAPVSHNYPIKKTSLVEGIQSISGKSLTDPMNNLKQLTDLPPSDNYVSSDGAFSGSSLSSRLSCLSPSSKDDNGRTNVFPRVKSSLDNARVSCTLDSQTGEKIGNEDIPVLCSDISSMKITDHYEHESLKAVGPKLLDPLPTRSPRNQGSEEQFYLREYGVKGGKRTAPPNLCLNVSSDHCHQDLVFQNQVPNALTEVAEDDIRTFDNQRLRDPEVGQHSSCIPGPSHLRSHSYIPSEASGSLNVDPLPVNNTLNGQHSLLASCSSTISNGYHDSFTSETVDANGVAASSIVYPKEVKGRQMGDNSAIAGATASSNTGESSIILNILSLDSDSWDDSLTSPHNLAKFLGETDEQQASIRTLTSRKVSNSSQSRFSFARQEESISQAFDFEPPYGVPGQLSGHGLPHKDGENRESFCNRSGLSNGFHPQSLVDADSFSGCQSPMLSGKNSVSRSQMLAPPGFSAPSKAPPPGFSSRERLDHHSFDSMSRNQLLDSTSWLSNLHQPSSAGNIGNTVDIEFMDPAILAVGKGRHQNGPNNLGFDVKPLPQTNTFESDSRLHSLLQGSPHQNLRYVSGDNYSTLNGTYGLSSRVLERSQIGSAPPLSQSTLQQARNGPSSNVHWDGWNDIQSGDSLGISQLLRNETLGLKRFYDGYEDSKLWMSGSGDLYNRNFGM